MSVVVLRRKRRRKRILWHDRMCLLRVEWSL